MKPLTTVTPGRALLLGVLCLLVFTIHPIHGGGQAKNSDLKIGKEKHMHHHVAGRHGMLVLGNKENIYLLHLAMRTASAHQFQLILKVDLVADPSTRIGDRSFVGNEISLDSTSANQVYFLDRNHPDNNVSIYTLRPAEKFPLIEIIEGNRTSFRGDFVRGHFERRWENPPDILANVTVRVKKILYAQQLQKPALEVPHPLDTGKMEFLLFGAGDEYFISHKITLHGEKKKPNNNGFHQVFAINKNTAEQLKVDLTRRAALIEIDNDHASVEGRLPVTGGKFPCRLILKCIETSLPLDLEALSEHYLEVLM
jgi:hypothetical protein